MVNQGLLERSKDGVSTGIRLWELATRGSKAASLRSAARPFMEDLQRTFQQHTQLAVLDGTDIVYIEKMSAATETVVNVTHVAKRSTASVASGGLVLAAFAPENVQQAIMASGIPRYTHLTPPDTRDFPRLFAEIRRQRFARADGWVDVGVTGIAAPIWDRQRNVVASLSLFLPNDKSSALAAIPAIQIAAASVSRALGWTPAQRSLNAELGKQLQAPVDAQTEV